jgi:methyl-accepting chemotaxis protein
MSGLEDGVGRAFVETGRFNTNFSLEPTIAAPLRAAVKSVDTLVSMTTDGLIAADPPRVAVPAYRAAVDDALTANSRLWRVLFDQEDVMLPARRNEDLTRQRNALVSVGVALVIIVALAEGELRRRATVRSRDEIGTLAVAFNTMAQRLEETYAGITETVRVVVGVCSSRFRSW